MHYFSERYKFSRAMHENFLLPPCSNLGTNPRIARSVLSQPSNPARYTLQRAGREDTRTGRARAQQDLRAVRTEDLCARMQPVTTGVILSADTGTAADDAEQRVTTAFAAWEASAQALAHIRQRLDQHDSLNGDHTTPARERIFADYSRAQQELAARRETLDLATVHLQRTVGEASSQALSVIVQRVAAQGWENVRDCAANGCQRRSSFQSNAETTSNAIGCACHSAQRFANHRDRVQFLCGRTTGAIFLWQDQSLRD